MRFKSGYVCGTNAPDNLLNELTLKVETNKNKGPQQHTLLLTVEKTVVLKTWKYIVKSEPDIRHITICADKKVQPKPPITLEVDNDIVVDILYDIIAKDDCLFIKYTGTSWKTDTKK